MGAPRSKGWRRQSSRNRHRRDRMGWGRLENRRGPGVKAREASCRLLRGCRQRGIAKGACNSAFRKANAFSTAGMWHPATIPPPLPFARLSLWAGAWGPRECRLRSVCGRIGPRRRRLNMQVQGLGRAGDRRGQRHRRARRPQFRRRRRRGRRGRPRPEGRRARGGRHRQGRRPGACL